MSTVACQVADPYVKAPFLKRFTPRCEELGLSNLTLELTGDTFGIWADKKDDVQNSMRVCLWDSHPRVERIVGNDTEPTVFGGYDYICASFRLTTLPSCCGVLVSHDTYVVDQWRGKGLAHLMHGMKDWLGGRLRIGKMIATVMDGNAAEEHILQKHGWVRGEPFTNHRTGRSIVQWEKVLKGV